MDQREHDTNAWRSHTACKDRSAEVAAAALDSLVLLALGRWEEAPAGPQGGRPTRTFVPCVTRDETDETPTDDLPISSAGGDEAGDDTSVRVTKPSTSDAVRFDATPSEANVPGDSGVEHREVSSVSSYVTHAPSGHDNPSTEPFESRGGFVTRGEVVCVREHCRAVTRW